jgi:hypothetical protein
MDVIMFKGVKNKLVKVKVVGIMTSMCNELVSRGDLAAGNYANLNSQILDLAWNMKKFEFSGGVLNIRPTNETIALFAFSTYIHASVTSGTNMELARQYQKIRDILTKAINAVGNPLNITSADHPLIHETFSMRLAS